MRCTAYFETRRWPGDDGADHTHAVTVEGDVTLDAQGDYQFSNLSTWCRYCYDQAKRFTPDHLYSHELQIAEDLLVEDFEDALEKESEAAQATSRPKLVAIRGGAA